MIVEIDYECLMDALAEADEDGRRIRASDYERSAPWLTEAGGPLLAWSMQHLEAPKVGIIGAGLMAGAYAYSLVDRRASVWVESDREPAPLPVLDGVAWDVALSYSSEDRSGHALRLRDALQARGVRTYLLDVAEDPQDSIWSIRFRQALFRSNYAVPILGEHYMKRDGTTEELRDMARLMRRFRRDTYFYPLIGLHDPKRPGVLPPHVTPGSGLDDLSFAWTHVPGLPMDVAPDVLARFFRSLARNAAGEHDLEWVGAIGPQIDAIRAADLGDGWGVELSIKHPTLTYYTIMLRPGLARFMGVNEPSEGALPCRDALAEVQEILARPPSSGTRGGRGPLSAGGARD